MNSNKPDTETAMHFLKLFSDTIREPFLILNRDLKVVGANQAFYRHFKVKARATENKFVYDLGDGQWNVPQLKTLLEEILPDKKILEDYEISSVFPGIGERIFLLNARQLDDSNQILLAFEDITLEREVATKLASYTAELERGAEAKSVELNSRIEELESLNKIMVGRELKMIELKEQIADLKRKGASK